MIGRLLRLCPLLLVAVLGSAALAAPAQAVPKYVHRVLAQTATGGSNGAGQVATGEGGAIAVNYSSVADGTLDPMGSSTDGYVYVAEGNHRVQVFSDDGEFQFMWGQGVLDGNPFPQVCRRTDASCTGGFIGSLGGSFNTPDGIAIDQATGHVFVRERHNNRVQEFTAAGAFVRAWGWDVVQEGGPEDTPTDQFETCFVASQCKIGASGSGAGQFGNFLHGFSGIGIDVHEPSGDVFVADPPARRILRFDVPASPSSQVVPLGSIGSAANFSNATQPAEIAIDDDRGILYASDAVDPGPEESNDIERYDLEGDLAPGGVPGFLGPISITAVTGNLVDAKRGTRGLEVDPDSGNLFVARDRDLDGLHTYVFEFGNAGSLNPAGVTRVETHLDGTGVRRRDIALDPDSGDLYEIGIRQDSALPQVLLAANDGPLPPAAAENFVYDTGSTTAQVDFSIDTNGKLEVEYLLRLANAATPTNFVTVASGKAEGSATPVPITAQVSGLRPAATYLVSVTTSKAFNNPSSSSAGPPLQTDKLPPLVSGLGADIVTGDSARLRAKVNPSGIGLTYRFEWGAGDFANSVPVPDAALAGGYGFEFVAEAIAGLTPSTTYQFRLVATSSDLSLPVVTSDAETFTTPALPPSVGRSFELVSAADKYGGQGLGFWPWGMGHIASAGTAAHSDERFLLSGVYGTSISKEGGFGLNSDFMLSERVDAQRGWQAQPLLTHPDYYPSVGKGLEIATGSTAEDFSSAHWRGPSQVLFFPEMALPHPDAAQPTWPVANPGWLSDWDGVSSGPVRWELFGPRGLGPDELVKQAELSSGSGFPWSVAVSADGSSAFGMTGLSSSGGPMIYGLGGSEDPTSRLYGTPTGDLVAGRSIYRVDLTTGLSDTLAGVGERDLVNVCTGAAGSDRTLVPVVTAGAVGAQECPAGGSGRERLISERGAAFTPTRSLSAVPQGVVSRDGSRVFFLSPDPNAPGVPAAGCTGTGASTLCPSQLYVSQRNPDGSTVTRWVSKAESGLFGQQAASLAGTVRFEGASRDGSVVYFRTNAPLTTDDPNGLGTAPPAGGVKSGTPGALSWDLYRFEMADGADPTGPGSSLTRVSAGPLGDGDCNSPRQSGTSDTDDVKALRFASEDGKRAYFTCAAPLPGVPATSNGTITAPGGAAGVTDQTNLYLFDAGLPQAQRWRFIARLPRGTSGGIAPCASSGVKMRSGFDGGSGFHPHISWNGGGANCVRGTADGGFITLFTTGRLTADVPGGTPVDEPSAKAVADIYGYDALADQLVRITAPQGGEETPYGCQTDNPNPTSPQDESLEYSCRGDAGVDSQVGSGGLWHLGVAVEPLVPGDRIAFFNSASRLVPEDEDGGYDVYQWHNGALSLVSSGSPDGKDTLYKGNDRTGRDLYLVTRDALSWQDTDAVTDVYSARVGGGIEEPPLPVLCEVLGGACKPPTPAPPAPSPNSSAVFEGTGNLVEKPSRPGKCAKGKVRKGDRCVKKRRGGKRGGKQARHGRAAGQSGRASR